MYIWKKKRKKQNTREMTQWPRCMFPFWGFLCLISSLHLSLSFYFSMLSFLFKRQSKEKKVIGSVSPDVLYALRHTFDRLSIKMFPLILINIKLNQLRHCDMSKQSLLCLSRTTCRLWHTPLMALLLIIFFFNHYFGFFTVNGSGTLALAGRLYSVYYKADIFGRPTH